jgi:hypothetical protein
VAAVLTISTPTALLSVAVDCFLIGLAVYLGHVWTRHLDPLAADGDSKAVFIVFIVSATVFYFTSSLAFSWVAAANGEIQVLHFLTYATRRLCGRDHESITPPPEPERNCGGGPDELARVMRQASELRHQLAALDSRIADLLEGCAQIEEQASTHRHEAVAATAVASD